MICRHIGHGGSGASVRRPGAQTQRPAALRGAACAQLGGHAAARRQFRQLAHHRIGHAGINQKVIALLSLCHIIQISI
jgi:hypothetical protein